MIEEKYIKRFWSYVTRGGEDECWPWQKSKLDAGYGLFGIKGKNKLTHRLAYEFTHGEGSAKGAVIRHSCDNPPCCNPAHLLKGGTQDNVDDKMNRGRFRCPKGEECVHSKLTEGNVHEIRDLLKKGMMHRIIAAKFGVHTVTITDINLRRSWRHI